MLPLHRCTLPSRLISPQLENIVTAFRVVVPICTVLFRAWFILDNRFTRREDVYQVVVDEIALTALIQSKSVNRSNRDALTSNIRVLEEITKQSPPLPTLLAACLLL